MGTEEQQPQQQPQKTPLGEKIKQLPKTLKVFWKTPPKGRYLNLKEIACFAGSAFGMSTVVTVVSGLITATQIPTIYNFNVIHGAWICLIASVLGLIIQPFFSKLLQNTSTRFGRYKPFILLLAPMLAVFAILATWQPQYTDVNDRIIYAYCTCIPTLILWNLFQNTYYMLPGVVTPNQQERADIWAPIGLVIGFSPTVMNVLGNVVKSVFTDQGREYMAYRILGFVYAAVGLALVLCLFKVKERLIVTNENKEKVGLIEGLKMVVKNKPLMVLTLALILGCCRTVIEIDAEYIGRLRYAVTELGEIDVVTGLIIFGSLTIITGFAATPNMILLPLMTRKFNSRTIMVFWAACNTIGYVILASIGIENIPQGTWSIVVITLLRFVALFNAIASLQPLMMAQLSDYQQLKTGKRLEGFIQTFLYALVLVFTNIGIVAMAYVKDALGYQSSSLVRPESIPKEEFWAPDPAAVESALNYYNIAFIVSAVSAALMLFTLLFYKLGKKEHAEIVRQLRERGLAQGNAQEEAESVGIAEHVEDELAAARAGISDEASAQEPNMAESERGADNASETPSETPPEGETPEAKDTPETEPDVKDTPETPEAKDTQSE
ncbi:MAG TPA: MFS transporter [Candidatus Caccalectryoclostridium excrementigallinarum]|uniref:MFS transporter n=1 Tax=Candidatus Caccalectryoclostridium excrementigallinarum TaxID=2840710 RepID=A0A9D1MLD2_9FIRM|nr:MFS transporter [Candidatus Caccalectryoclostridium excrementigallinarum]